jgi:WD40 repeat protein/predicted Ser/Thr protein kinase
VTDNEQVINAILDRWESEAGNRECPSVEELCRGRPDLIDDVYKRIADLRVVDKFLERPSPGQGAWAIPEGTYINSFRVVRELGRGGMGIVYECEQEQLGRKVAVKIIHPHRVTPDTLRRFELESHVQGMLQHENIARVFEAGVADMGVPTRQPYLAMELVEGHRLDEYANGQQLGVADRIHLLVTLCETIEYAHQRGVIHRDVKPANILVDSQGRPVILDFGIARLLPDLHTLTKSDLQTQTYGAVGSLAYMSPEQVSENAAELDTRSDVYALGLIGYELLTGRLPYEAKQGPLAAIIRAITESPPVPLRAIDPALARDLDAIFAKVLMKEKELRYQSAAELASDLQRFLAGEPSLARPIGVLEKAQLWVRRNRGLALAGALAAISCLIGLFFSSGFAWLANRRAGQLDQLVARLDDEKQKAEQQSQMYQRASYNSELARIGMLVRENPTAAWQQLENSELLPPDLRVFAWQLSRRMSQRNIAAINCREQIAHFAVSGDDRLLAVQTVGGAVTLWDLPGRRAIRSMPSVDTLAFHLAMSHDGQWLAAAVDGGVQLWNVAENDATQRLDVTRPIYELTFSPQRELLAIGLEDEIRVFEIAGNVWKERNRFPLTSTPLTVQFVPRVAMLMSINRRGQVVGWNVETGEKQRETELPQRAIVADFANHNPWVACSGNSRVLSVWNWKTGERVSQVASRLPRAARHLTFSADDRYVATVGAGTVRLFDSVSGQQYLYLPGSDDVSQLCSLTARNAILSTTGAGINVWRSDESNWRRSCQWASKPLRDAVFVPRSDVVVAGGEDGYVRLWHADTGAKIVRTAAPSGKAITAVAASANNHIAYNENSTTIVVRKLAENALGSKQLPEVQRLETPEQINSLAFSGDNRYLASCGDEGTTRIWQLNAGKMLHVLDHKMKVTAVAFSPDCQALATASEDHRVRLWEVRRGRLIDELDAHTEGVLCLAFSPDGGQLTSGGRDAQAIVWDLETGRPLYRLKQNQPRVRAVAYSPDGAVIATGGQDVVFWDSQTGQQKLSVESNRRVTCLAFSPNGHRLALLDRSDCLTLWDAMREWE